MFDPNDAKQLALEIEKIYKRIGLSNPFSKTEKDLDKLKAGLEEAREILLEWDEGVGDIERGFRSISNEVKTTGNSFNMVKRSLTSITSISAQIRDHQLGINQLSSKQLTQYRSKLASEAASLSNNVKLLQAEKDELDELAKKQTLLKEEKSRLAQLNILIDNANGLSKEGDSIQKKLNEKLDQEIQQRETIEKKLGLVGGMLRGISKIPILGDLVDTNEALHVAESTIESTESSVSGLGAAMGNLGKQAISGLLNPANLVVGAITMMINALKDVDKGAGDFAKSMNMTYSEALDVRGELAVMAAMSGDVALNSERLQESLGYINQQLGTNGKLSEQDLKTFTKLREQSGLTNEQLFSMQKYTMATGGTLKDNISTFQATSKILSYQNKVSLNTKQLMVDMGSVSNRTKLSIEGGAAGLAKAAFNAKLMGSNLEQVSSIADQLLNFESSIEAELSAELLTGRDITLEKARQAALNNDLATVSSEITRQIGSAAEYGNMNRIQQEAMAKAVGMTADQLADVLFEQEAIRAVGGKLSDEEKRAFETAKDKYGLEQASKMLQEGQLDKLVKQQSTQDRFNDSVEKLKEIFVQLAEPMLKIITPFADLVTNVLPLVNMVLQPAIATLRTISSLISGIIKLITFNFNGAMEDLSPSNLFKGFTDLSAASKNKQNSTNTLTSSSTSVGDMQYNNKTGKTTISTKEGGLYSISDNDQINVHPELKPSNNRITPPTPNTSMNNDAFLAKLEKYLSKLDNLEKMQDRPVVVHSTVQLPNGEVLARSTNETNRKTHYGVQ